MIGINQSCSTEANVLSIRKKEKKLPIIFRYKQLSRHNSDARLIFGLKGTTHLAQIELAQAVIDPFLHVQSLLKLFPVVFYSYPRLSLLEMAPMFLKHF